MEQKKFPLAAPSCLLRGNVAENCRYLQGRVREAGITLFEAESCLAYTREDLPQDLARLGLAYHAHLPLDLEWGKGVSFVFGQVRGLVDMIAYLKADRFVLHPPQNRAKLEKFAVMWTEAGFDSRSLLIENINGNDLSALWPVILKKDLGVCLDLGHILAYAQQDILNAPGLWERVGLLHVYGLEKNKRHLGLENLDNMGSACLQRILKNVNPGTVVLIELFSREEFAKSRLLLSALMHKWGMELDYPYSGRE